MPRDVFESLMVAVPGLRGTSPELLVVDVVGLGFSPTYIQHNRCIVHISWCTVKYHCLPMRLDPGIPPWWPANSGLTEMVWPEVAFMSQAVPVGTAHITGLTATVEDTSIGL